MVATRGVTRHLYHETRLGSQERDEMRFLDFFFKILDEYIGENCILFN